MDSNLVPFPRGGGVSTTNTGSSSGSNVTAIHDDKNENLFQNNKKRKIIQLNENNNKNQKKDNNKQKNKLNQKTQKSIINTNSIENVGLGTMITTLNTNQNIKKIELLNSNKYYPGILVIGYILQITEKFIILNLPGGMIATVPFVEISDIHYKHYNNLDNQV